MTASRSCWAIVLVVLGAARAAAEEIDIGGLVGVYQNGVAISYSQADELIDATDVLLVARYGDGAYFHLRKSFDHGHMCEMSGIAVPEGNALVFRAGRKPDTPACVARIVRQDDEIVIHDVGERCQSLHCGARGSVSGGFPLNTRQPIEDMDDLQATPEYQDAVARYTAGNNGSRQ